MPEATKGPKMTESSPLNDTEIQPIENVSWEDSLLQEAQSAVVALNLEPIGDPKVLITCKVFTPRDFSGEVVWKAGDAFLLYERTTGDTIETMKKGVDRFRTISSGVNFGESIYTEGIGFTGSSKAGLVIECKLDKDFQITEGVLSFNFQFDFIKSSPKATTTSRLNALFDKIYAARGDKPTMTSVHIDIPIDQDGNITGAPDEQAFLLLSELGIETVDKTTSLGIDVLHSLSNFAQGDLKLVQKKPQTTT